MESLLLAHYCESHRNVGVLLHPYSEEYKILWILLAGMVVQQVNS